MWFKRKPKNKLVAEYDARQIANWFVARFRADKRELTIMQLLKLVYIVHGWYLGFTDKPLFANRVEAWKFGPVVVDVYEAFKDQNPDITEAYSNPRLTPKKLSKPVEELLDAVYDDYAHLAPYALSKITHRADGPWAVVSRMGGRYALIPSAVIRAYYRGRVKQWRENQQHA